MKEYSIRVAELAINEHGHFVDICAERNGAIATFSLQINSADGSDVTQNIVWLVDNAREIVTEGIQMALESEAEKDPTREGRTGW